MWTAYAPSRTVRVSCRAVYFCLSQLMADELLPRFASLPAGEFSMGADDGDEDERPAHRVSLDAFHLSIHPITNQQYAEFIRATSHPFPAVRDLPLVVTPSHELTFRELSSTYAWRAGESPAE